MNGRIAVIAVLFGLSSFCAGQEVPQLADQPVFVARFNGWSQEGFAEYVRELNRDLQVGSRITEAIDKQKSDVGATTIATPASGVLVYLRRGLIPAAEQIQYSEVASQDEFEKLVRAQKLQFGDSSVVEGSDDRFKLVHTTVVRTDITEQALGFTESDGESGIQVKQVSASSTAAPTSEMSETDIPEGHQTSIMIGPFGVSSSSTDSNGRIVEENGRRFRDNSFTVTTYYRYHDGFILSGNTAMLWDMNLPSTEVLRDQNNAELNGQLSFYPDRIPTGFRQLGWDVLSAAAGSELQQHDDEPVAEYAWRRASGKALIELGELQLLKISMPVEFSNDVVRLSHAYIAHADSCLWFAIGGENAHDIIRLSLERCRESGGRMRTPLLTAAIDFDRLLAYPQDDATGLTAISPICCNVMEETIRLYAAVVAGPDQSYEYDPELSFRALQMGGSKKISLVFAADESGLLLSGTLGTALLRSGMATAVEMLDQMATTMGPPDVEPTTDSEPPGSND